MIEIKTITENYPHKFDRAVNEALADGWELVRRECFITGSDRATTFYAELERVGGEPEEETEYGDTVAEWQISKDPAHPFRCSACQMKSAKAASFCPFCKRVMIGAEE